MFVMRMITKTAAITLALSTALLAGCSQAATTDAEDATTRQEVVEQQAEPEPELAMSDWQDTAFYERPVHEIVSDLELMGFELTDQYREKGDGYDYLLAYFQGDPAENPLEGADKTVTLAIQVDNPTFSDGAEEEVCATLADDAIPNSFNVDFYFPSTDPSDYDALAERMADTLGLGEIVDGSVVESPFNEGQMLGNYSGNGSFNGIEASWMIIVSPQDGDTPNPDAPLLASYSYYVTEDMA